MSYCRWHVKGTHLPHVIEAAKKRGVELDDEDCDLYVYDADGGISINVADCDKNPDFDGESFKVDPVTAVALLDKLTQAGYSFPDHVREWIIDEGCLDEKKMEQAISGYEDGWWNLIKSSAQY